jgi:hypothetical protein
MNIKLPYVIDTSINDSVQDFVYNTPSEYWVLNTYGNTINRRFCILNNLNLPFVDRVKEYNKRIFNLIGLFELEEETRFGNFIGVNTHGGNVHPHIDTRNANNWEHVRINFLISKPESGGQPVVNDNLIDIEEGYSWINISSLWPHYSTPVIGNKPRIVLSLGAYINPQSLKNIGII